jgi:hypothetical protein
MNTKSGVAMALLLLVGAIPACGSSGSSTSSTSAHSAATDAGGDAADDVDASALFTADWLCSLTLNPGSTPFGGTEIKSVTHGSSLSLYAQESDSLPQSWFCGFNYTISGLSATLVGMPTCSSYSNVQLQSATISITSDGTQMSVKEQGTEMDSGGAPPAQYTFSGTCSRNSN